MFIFIENAIVRQEDDVVKLLKEDTEYLNSLLSPHVFGILSEAYYGRNPLIEDCIEQLTIIKSKLKSGKNIINGESEEIKQIESNLRDLFNVEDVSICWSNTNAIANAFTFPFSNLIFTKHSRYDLTRGKYGPAFKSRKGKIMLIHLFSSLFTTADLEPDEVMAIIMHECGHNFFNSKQAFAQSRITFLATLTYLIVVLTATMRDAAGPSQLLQQLISAVSQRVFLGAPVTSKVIKNLTDNVLISKLRTVASKITDIFNNLMHINAVASIFWSFLEQIGNWKVVATQTGFQALTYLVTSKNAYENEKFSDNFATSYGLGPQIASSTLKISQSKNSTQVGKFIHENLPEMASAYNGLMTLSHISRSIMDCHPDEYTRVEKQLSMLKSEIKKGKIPKTAKEEILVQIKDLEDLVDKMNSSSFHKENHEEVKYFLHNSMPWLFNIKEKLSSRDDKNDFEYEELNV